jgi:hypothetical protein
VVTKYEELHKQHADKALESVFKWWLPQAVEVLATVGVCVERFDALRLVEVFVSQSVLAIYFLVGEFLLFKNEYSLEIPSDDQLAQQIRTHKIACKEHSDSLRKVIGYEQKLKIENFEQSATESNRSSHVSIPTCVTEFLSFPLH